MFMAWVWKGGNNASLAGPSFVPSPHTVQLAMRRYLQPCPAVRSGTGPCGIEITIACLEDPIYARSGPHRGGYFTANVILFKGDDGAKLLEHAHGTPVFANQGEEKMGAMGVDSRQYDTTRADERVVRAAVRDSGILPVSACVARGVSGILTAAFEFDR